MQSFVFGGNTGVSYDSLQKRRQIAQSLMQQKEAPKYAVTGLADAAKSIVGALLDRKLEGQEKEMREGFNADFASALGGGSFGSTGGLPAAEGMQGYRDAIASIESAGSGDYKAVGPTHSKLGRALGRYQIMEANIGPWSREALGREVSADEFLANPALQDAIFDHKFGGYVQQFGPEGAAQAWFAGPGGVGKMGRKDSLGTSVADYTRKFSNALGGSGVQQVASQANMAQLISLADNPMATEGQRAVVSAILNQQLQANDPRHQLEMQNLQSQIDARTAPKPGYTQKTGAELGLTGEQAGMLFNVGPDNKITQIGGGGTNVSTTVNTGDPIDARPMADKPSKDYQRRWDEENKTWIDEPIPGTDAAREIESAASKKDERERQQTIKMGTTLTNIHMNIEEIQNGGMPVTGLIGALGGKVPGTPQADWRARNEQITTSAALAEVQNMRDNSPTGGAVGQLTDSEREAIALAASGISNAQSKEEYVRAAENYRKVMLDTAYGEGTWRLDPETGAVSVTAGELAEIEGAEAADFGEATLDDLLKADISTMTSEQMDAWEKRMKELQGGR